MTARQTDCAPSVSPTGTVEPAAVGAATTHAARKNLLALGRFVAAGCAGNVVYSLVFLALAQSTDNVTVPSLIASVASTLAVNEAHRLWTFRGIGRPSLLQAHLSGAASALVGTALTAGALLVWTWLFPDASVTSDLAISWGVTAMVGAGNFLHLRRASTAGSRRASPSQPQGLHQQGAH